MLEARIEELTKAVRDLIDAMHNQQSGYWKSSLPVDTLANVGREAKAMGDSVKSKVPNETPKSSPATNTSEPSSPESAPVTYADVKKLVIEISKASRDKAMAALQRLGVGNAKELKDHQWAAAVAYLGKVAAGEVDPESAHD